MLKPEKGADEQMGRFLLKPAGICALTAAAAAALSYFKKKTTPEYVEIYSDEDELF